MRDSDPLILLLYVLGVVVALVIGKFAAAILRRPWRISRVLLASLLLPFLCSWGLWVIAAAGRKSMANFGEFILYGAVAALANWLPSMFLAAQHQRHPRLFHLIAALGASAINCMLFFTAHAWPETLSS